MPLTVSMLLLPGRALPDSASPLLRLLQVRVRVLQRGEPKALLHSLPREPRAHPPAFERVEVRRKVPRRVRLVLLSVRPAADAVPEAQHHLAAPGRCRGEPLDDELPLGQAHRTPDFQVIARRKFSVQRDLLAVRVGAPPVHPERFQAGKTGKRKVQDGAALCLIANRLGVMRARRRDSATASLLLLGPSSIAHRLFPDPVELQNKGPRLELFR